MESILPKAWHPRLRHFLPVLACVLNSCAYRFSNSSMKPPEGIRTIAVEAVYDTSRDVIPHEFIWSAVQREIVRSGRLVLTRDDEADALMTLWVTRSIVSPAGTPNRTDASSRDPTITAENKGDPTQFRDLRRAGISTIDEQVAFRVEVEVHDLKTRKVLFKNAYDQTTLFKSLRGEKITPVSSGFLHYEEALQSKVKLLSEQLAQQVVSDFFNR